MSLNLEVMFDCIIFRRSFVELGIGVTGALMLSQALYWSKRTKDEEGWFYKTRKEWEEETGMSRKEQETARKKLVTKGILEEKKGGNPCQMAYRVNLSVLNNLLENINRRG